MYGRTLGPFIRFSCKYYYAERFVMRLLGSYFYLLAAVSVPSPRTLKINNNTFIYLYIYMYVCIYND